jgi:hypothetical protein
MAHEAPRFLLRGMVGGTRAQLLGDQSGSKSGKRALRGHLETKLGVVKANRTYRPRSPCRVMLYCPSVSYASVDLSVSVAREI